MIGGEQELSGSRERNAMALVYLHSKIKLFVLLGGGFEDISLNAVAFSKKEFKMISSQRQREQNIWRASSVLSTPALQVDGLMVL